MTDFEKIKEKILADYKFIKYNGKILSQFIKELLQNNDDDVDKIFIELENMSKKQMIAHFERIISDLATADEISYFLKETIDKKKKQIYTLEEKIEESTTILESLEEKVQSVQESIITYEKEYDDKTLQKTLDYIQKDLTLTQSYEEKEYALAVKYRDLDLQFKEKEIALGVKHKNLDLQFKEKEIALGVKHENLDLQFKEKEIALANMTQTLNSFKFSDDYAFEKCDSVLTYENDIYNFGNTHHIHYLDTEKFCPLTLSGDELYDEKSNYYNQYFNINSPLKSVKIIFPIHLKFSNDEFIVSFFNVKNVLKQKPYEKYYCHNLEMEFEQFIIYITNYGRIIISDKAKFVYERLDFTDNFGRNPGTRVQFLLKTAVRGLEFTYTSEYYNAVNCGDGRVPRKFIYYKKSTPETFPLQMAEPLLYKMPKLFLNVINAFQNHNTVEMQECCKQYFHIRHKDAEKEKIAFSEMLSEKEKIILEKDKIISEKDLEIYNLKEEMEKMKVENQKLKDALKALT